jgi:hypothetical protein
VIFLLGVLIAAAASAVLIIPAWQERNALRESVLCTVPPDPTPHSDTWRLAKATRELEAALGPAAKDPEGAVTRIARLAAPSATVRWEAGALLVTLPRERLPALLLGLSGPGAPPFVRVQAGPGEDAKTCLVTLVPEDTTAR